MSITLKTKIVLTTSIIVSTKIVEQLTKERVEARAITPEKLERLKGQEKAMHLVMVSDKTDEEVLEIVLRTGFREGFLETLKSDFSGEDFRAKGSQVSITYKGKAPKVVAE
jgi:galactitol-specific phosphotransferase system IIB component